MDLIQIMREQYNKTISECTDREIYEALLLQIKKEARARQAANGKKKLYYISAEFLIGKLLSNNLINLGVYDEVKQQLEENGKSLSAIEEMEPEPSLGNGGLGRLAACFLDSIATLGLNGDGIGLNYHFGLFRQVFEANSQKTLPDPWIQEVCWPEKTNVVYPVQLGDRTVSAVLYDISIMGYEGVTNKLHLFDIEGVDESVVEDGISFDKEDITKNLTLFLYPDDREESGRLLRIYQQYFMVSAAAQLILEECTKKGSQLYDLPDYAVIQINDTHPAMVIPELIRLLVKRGLHMDEAIEVVSRTCAYTNHTILAEALEKWPLAYLKKAVPCLVPIIETLDQKVRARFADRQVQIIDDEKRVHMAHIAIHYSFCVNGVASLHTDILKQNELKHFYQIYPGKFQNKTNGITFRRWLLHCNPQLVCLITSLIGEGWKKDANQLEKLLDYTEDERVLEQFLTIKQEKKRELCTYLERTQGVTIREDAIFDIQIKRLHEYKRQQLNALYVIHKYLTIKAGERPKTPITVIFGAKAAPAYVIAQDIIHLILCLQELIQKDEDVAPYLQVVMVENYNVTLAEKLIPACEISQQISLASKEASGTGNMKLMLNGAVTLGTEDGANVEIHQLVGDGNIYVFGENSQVVVERYKKGDYSPMAYYQKDARIREAVDFILGKELTALGDKVRLERLYKELLSKDWFMTFPDFADYIKTRERIYADYEDRKAWAVKMLVNIAKAGYFSSDRTIAEYNRDIWKLDRREQATETEPLKGEKRRQSNHGEGEK